MANNFGVLHNGTDLFYKDDLGNIQTVSTGGGGTAYGQFDATVGSGGDYASIPLAIAGGSKNMLVISNLSGQSFNFSGTGQTICIPKGLTVGISGNVNSSGDSYIYGGGTLQFASWAGLGEIGSGSISVNGLSVVTDSSASTNIFGAGTVAVRMIGCSCVFSGICNFGFGSSVVSCTVACQNTSNFSTISGSTVGVASGNILNINSPGLISGSNITSPSGFFSTLGECSISSSSITFAKITMASSFRVSCSGVSFSALSTDSTRFICSNCEFSSCFFKSDIQNMNIGSCSFSSCIFDGLKLGFIGILGSYNIVSACIFHGNTSNNLYTQSYSVENQILGCRIGDQGNTSMTINLGASTTRSLATGNVVGSTITNGGTVNTIANNITR